VNHVFSEPSRAPADIGPSATGPAEWPMGECARPADRRVRGERPHSVGAAEQAPRCAGPPDVRAAGVLRDRGLRLHNGDHDAAAPLLWHEPRSASASSNPPGISPREPAGTDSDNSRTINCAGQPVPPDEPHLIEFSINSTFNEPCEVARQLASLDHLSGGRTARNEDGKAFYTDVKGRARPRIHGRQPRLPTSRHV
jgi:hypothetical protein